MNWKKIILTFVIAGLAYFGGFYGIEHLRTRKGGWEVTFQADGSGAPGLTVGQPHLRISNVSFAFPDQHVAVSNLNMTIVFDRPITNVPFGRVVYFDTTFLPGSVVFDILGHQIQLVPRVLIVDQKEIAWRSGTVLSLPAAAPNAPGKGRKGGS